MVSIPNHKNWTTFKKKFEIPAGAVKGVDMGKSLDKYHNGLSGNFLKNADLAKEVSDVMAKYLKGISDSKVAKGKFSAFKSEFTSDYLAQAEAAIEEFKSMGGDKEAFGGRVGLLLKSAAKLKAGASLAELQGFRSGPVRGMMAAATKVKGYDPASLVQHWTPVDDVINKLGGDVPQTTLDKVVAAVAQIAQQTKTIAAKDQLPL